MAGVGGEEPGLSQEDSGSIPPQTPPVVDGSLVSFGTEQNGTVNVHLPRSLQNDVDPKESLTSLRHITSVAAMHVMPDYDTLYQMLQERERNLDLAARLGQALLQRNEMLEADLSAAVDVRQRHEHQIAQLKHDLVKKEALVQLYLEDVNERENQLRAGDGEGEPGWVKELAEECHQLRESNELLHMETEKLRKETQDIELKEKDLLQLCLEQLAITKQNLGELRHEVEGRSAENHRLHLQLDERSLQRHQDQAKLDELLSENEDLKEKLTVLEATHSSATCDMDDLQQRYEQCVALLQEKHSEIQSLKEMSGYRSAPSESAEGSESFLGAVEHESIVHEIEEALRKEIVAASMLSERPRSPNHYAQQRTMVVMETVRAATMATAKRRERLKHEQGQGDKVDVPSGPQDCKGTSELDLPSLVENNTGLMTPSAKGFSPLSRGKFSNGKYQKSFTPKNSSSPVPSKGSAQSMQGGHHAHSYFSPEKLQIVKPLEGSVTLLRWKLLASPQLGGAKAYFSAASPPGVHVKGWSVAGIIDNSSSPDAPTPSHVPSSGQKHGSVGFADLSSLEASDLMTSSHTVVPPSATPKMASSITHHWLRTGAVNSSIEVCSTNDSGLMHASFSSVTDVM